MLDRRRHLGERTLDTFLAYGPGFPLAAQGHALPQLHIGCSLENLHIAQISVLYSFQESEKASTAVIVP
jgi:hypothetical protein